MNTPEAAWQNIVDSYLEAVNQGNLGKLKKLLHDYPKLISVRDKYGKTPLYCAAEKNRHAMAGLLLAKGSDANSGNGVFGRTTPLHEAAERGHTEIVKLLLAGGADINAEDIGTPLHKAANRGHAAVVSLLIASGADVNADASGSPLYVAAESGKTAVAILLLANGADVNGKKLGGGPLHKAAERGHTEIVALLLACNADVDARTWDGDTPLHLAAGRGHVEIAKLLLGSSAGVNAKNKNGDTPLHKAAVSDWQGTEVVKLLLASGADVNDKNKKGDTPLRIAAAPWKSKEILQLMEIGGADTDGKPSARNALAVNLPLTSKAESKDDIDGTLLRWAAKKEVVRLLLASKAVGQANATNAESTLHDTARKWSHDVAVYLYLLGGVVAALLIAYLLRQHIQSGCIESVGPDLCPALSRIGDWDFFITILVAESVLFAVVVFGAFVIGLFSLLWRRTRNAEFLAFRERASNWTALLLTVFLGSSLIGAFALKGVMEHLTSMAEQKNTVAVVRLQNVFSGQYMALSETTGFASALASSPVCLTGKVIVLDNSTSGIPNDEFHSSKFLDDFPLDRSLISQLDAAHAPWISLPLYFGLPEGMRAATVTEATTVVLIDWNRKFSTSYGPQSLFGGSAGPVLAEGYSIEAIVSVIDRSRRLYWHTQASFRGASPPEKVSLPSGRHNVHEIYGPMPFSDIEKYLRGLPECAKLN